MSKTPFLAPAEYRDQLESAFHQRDSAAVAQLVAQLAPRRYPGLIADGHYYLPACAALSCYRENPAESKQELSLTLGPPQSEDHWPRLAAFIKYVYEQRDWTMLGHLAYQVDWGLVACASERDQARHTKQHGSKKQMSASASTGLRFCRTIQSVCDLPQGILEPKEYLQAALGYFRALPTEFAVPPDLVEYTTFGKNSSECEPSPLDWPMLRFFWKTSRGSWNQVPQSLELLAKSPNPFLSVLAAQLRGSKDVPEARESAREIARESPPQLAQDPFQELAGEHAVELSQPPTLSPQTGSSPGVERTIFPPDSAPAWQRVVRRTWNRVRSWWRSWRGGSSKKVR
ncbi:MAG: hypothetical protein ACC628_18830 [Pirellulaceae bacterium]